MTAIRDGFAALPSLLEPERGLQILRWMLGAIALLFAATVLLSVNAPVVTMTIDSGHIEHFSGHAWLTPARPAVPWPWHVAGDGDAGQAIRAYTQVFEDGRPLAPAHALHERIAADGQGFSHWLRVLVFAASDGTDPRANGRVYTAVFTTQAPPLLINTLIAALLLWFGFASALLVRMARDVMPAAGPIRRLERHMVVVGLGLVAVMLAVQVLHLWDLRELITLSPDSPAYLAPAAASLLAGDWAHVGGRGFVYPATALLAIWFGGGLHGVVLFQLLLYILAGALLYLVVLSASAGADRSACASGRCPGRTAAHLVGALSVIGYFVFSGHYFASAFLVGPELVSSVTMLAGLWLCLQLLLDRDISSRRCTALVALAGLSAALLVGMKPALAGTAALTLALALLGLARQYQPPRLWRMLLGATLLATPGAVLCTDHTLAERFYDGEAQSFGPVTAFCNNADLVDHALQSPVSRAAGLLGPEGTAAFRSFLEEVQRDRRWTIQGFNGDACVYELAPARRVLEQAWFRTDPGRSATGYRKLLAASIADEPAAFARRIQRQLVAFLFGRSPCDCARETTSVLSPDDPGVRDLPLVKQIIGKADIAAGGKPLNRPWFIDESCTAMLPSMQRLHIVFSLGGVLGVIALAIRRRPVPAPIWRLASATAVGVLFWLSTAAVVAVVHTFDVERYITVGFPLYIAMLALMLYLLLGMLWTLIMPAPECPPPDSQPQHAATG